MDCPSVRQGHPPLPSGSHLSWPRGTALMPGGPHNSSGYRHSWIPVPQGPSCFVPLPLVPHVPTCVRELVFCSPPTVPRGRKQTDCPQKEHCGPHPAYPCPSVALARLTPGGNVPLASLPMKSEPSGAPASREPAASSPMSDSWLAFRQVSPRALLSQGNGHGSH